METPQEILFKSLQEKGIIKFSGTYSEWQNRNLVAPKTEEEHSESFLKWKNKLSSEDQKLFDEAFGK